MNLTFRIEYRTTWGECLYVVLNNEIEVELSTTDGHLWQGSCEYLPAEEGQVIAYRYAVYRNGKCIRKEFGAIAHTFFPADIHEHHYIFDDSWRDLPAESYRYSSAFNGIYTPQTPALPTEYDASYITFRALCPGLGIRHQALALTGEGTILGNWGKDSKPIRMQEVQPNVWQLALKTDNLPQVTDYKFVAIDEQTGNLVGNTAEFAGGRTVLAQDAELVTHQGMIHYMDCHIQLLAVNEKSSGQSTLCCPLYAVKAPHRIDGKAPVYSVPALAYP